MALHSVVVFTSSGLVVFSQHSSSTRGVQIATHVHVLCGAIRAVIEQGRALLANRLLSYVEGETTTLSVAEHPDTPLFCVVVLDRSVERAQLGWGEHLSSTSVSRLVGRLLTSAIVAAFADEHSAELEAAVGGFARSTTESFAFRLPGVVRAVVRTLLSALTRPSSSTLPPLDADEAVGPEVEGGILVALLLSEDGVVESSRSPLLSGPVSADSSGILAGVAGLDDVALMSTVRPVLAAASELSELRERGHRNSQTRHTRTDKVSNPHG
jgi:hypothetical protein